MTRCRQLLALVVLTALPVTPALGADANPAFTLGKAVPSDVYIYLNAAHNPEKEYLEKYWADVWTAFKKSGVIEDVHTLITSSVQQPAEKENFEKFWKRAGELIEGVDWNARIKEFVYAGKMSTPMPEYLFLIRYEDEAKAGKNAEAFAAVLKEIESAAAGEGSGITYVEEQAHGGTIRSLHFKDAAFLNLRVGVRGPVVALAIDNTMLDASFSLLAGEGEKKSLVQSERYTQAMAKLPAPEDIVVFFDVHATIQGIQNIVKFAGEQAPQDEKSREMLQLVNKGLDEFNLLDYMATTAHTEGYRELTDSIVTLSPGASKSRLFKVFCKPEPIEKFDRFIPKEAIGYSTSSGIDWSALYAAVLDFIENEVPEGKDLLVKWDDAQNQIGFHPQADVFSWLDSQMTSVSLPAATPTPFSPQDWVVLIKVKNEKQAAEKVKAGLDKLNQVLTGFQQPLTSQPADIPGTEGFRMVTHPMMAMFLRPVYGVADGHLIISNSQEAIQTCLATAKGEHPSVVKNERVTREGLIPKGPVTSASFSDMTDMGKTLAQALSGMGIFSAMIPDQPDTRPIRGMFGIFGKLAPVAMKLNFFVSQSSVTTFEHETWHTRSVINYRSPQPAQPESAPAGGK